MNLKDVTNFKMIGNQNGTEIKTLIYQKDKNGFLVKRFEHTDSVITSYNIDSVGNPKAYFGYVQIPNNSWPGLDVGDITPVLYIADEENHSNDQYYYVSIWGLAKKVGNYANYIKNVISLGDIFKANRGNFGSGSRTTCNINITNGDTVFSIELTGTSFIITNEGVATGFDDISTITLRWTYTTGVLLGFINGTNYSNIAVVKDPNSVSAWSHLISNLPYEIADQVKELQGKDDEIEGDFDNLRCELTELIDSLEQRVDRIESEGISSYVSR